LVEWLSYFVVEIAPVEIAPVEIVPGGFGGGERRTIKISYDRTTRWQQPNLNLSYLQ
jgi:hypothetical protein